MDGNSKRALHKSAKPKVKNTFLSLLLLLPPIITIIYLFI